MKIKETELENVKKIGIYCITNLVNGKKYIGKTGNKRGFIHRWNVHKNDFKRNKHYNSHFQRAFNKYGIDNFEFSILEIIEPTDDITKLNQILNEREQYWINYYNTYNPNNGYNLTKGGEGCLGLIVSEETKQKQSKIRKGRIITEEWKQKISNTLKGKIISAETKKKMSESFKGRVYSIEHNKKISEGQKLRQQGINNTHKAKPIVRIDINGDIYKYSYLNEVKKYGFSSGNVCSCCNNKLKYYKNFIWLYKEEYDKMSIDELKNKIKILSRILEVK